MGLRGSPRWDEEGKLARGIIPGKIAEESSQLESR